MANTFVSKDGSYYKKVPDSGEAPEGGAPQSKSKFSNPVGTPKYSGPQPSQKPDQPKTVSENRVRP